MKYITFVPIIYSCLVYADPCYFPDGTLATGHTPCGSAKNSTCCDTGYACLSNHLCQYTKDAPGSKARKYQFLRESCTDQTHTSPECPRFCNVIPGAKGLRTMGVEKCENEEDRFWCSDNVNKQLEDSVKCSNSSYYFEPGEFEFAILSSERD